MENLYGFEHRLLGPIPKRDRLAGESIKFPIYRDIPHDPKAQLALALYREALTVNSIPFSFLSYFKILNMFWNDRKNREGQNEIVEGLRTTLPCLIEPEALRRIAELTTQGRMSQNIFTN